MEGGRRLFQKRDQQFRKRKQNISEKSLLFFFIYFKNKKEEIHLSKRERERERERASPFDVARLWHFSSFRFSFYVFFPSMFLGCYRTPWFFLLSLFLRFPNGPSIDDPALSVPFVSASLVNQVDSYIEINIPIELIETSVTSFQVVSHQRVEYSCQLPPPPPQSVID